MDGVGGTAADGDGQLALKGVGLAVHRVDAVQVGLDLHALAGGLIGGGGNGGNGEVIAVPQLETGGSGQVPHGHQNKGVGLAGGFHKSFNLFVGSDLTIAHTAVLRHKVFGIVQRAGFKAVLAGLAEHIVLQNAHVGVAIAGVGHKAHADPGAVGLAVLHRTALGEGEVDGKSIVSAQRIVERERLSFQRIEGTDEAVEGRLHVRCIRSLGVGIVAVAQVQTGQSHFFNDRVLGDGGDGGAAVHGLGLIVDGPVDGHLVAGFNGDGLILALARDSFGSDGDGFAVGALTGLGRTK